MTVYVDELRWVQRTQGWRYDRACHMLADTVGELHAFAGRLQLRRSWFQAQSRWPHYDLTANKRAQAVKAGAIEVRAREFLRRFMEAEDAR